MESVIIDYPTLATILVGRSSKKLTTSFLSLVNNKSINQIIIDIHYEDEELEKMVASYAKDDIRIHRKPIKDVDLVDLVASLQSEYISFVGEGVQTVASGYWELLKKAAQTHSDILTGTVRNANRKSLFKQAFILAESETSLTEYPTLVFDDMLFNKIYRRQFFLEQSVKNLTNNHINQWSFVLSAFYNAAKIDIVLSPVVKAKNYCLFDNHSVSYLEAYLGLMEYFIQESSAEVRQYLIEKVILADLPQYLAILPRFNDEDPLLTVDDLDRMSSLITNFFSKLYVNDTIVDRLSPNLQLAYFNLVNGDIDALMSLFVESQQFKITNQSGKYFIEEYPNLNVTTSLSGAAEISKCYFQKEGLWIKGEWKLPKIHIKDINLNCIRLILDEINGMQRLELTIKIVPNWRSFVTQGTVLTFKALIPNEQLVKLKNKLWRVELVYEQAFKLKTPIIVKKELINERGEFVNVTSSYGDEIIVDGRSTSILLNIDDMKVEEDALKIISSSMVDNLTDINSILIKRGMGQYIEVQAEYINHSIVLTIPLKLISKGCVYDIEFLGYQLAFKNESSIYVSQDQLTYVLRFSNQHATLSVLAKVTWISNAMLNKGQLSLLFPSTDYQNYIESLILYKTNSKNYQKLIPKIEGLQLSVNLANQNRYNVKPGQYQVFLQYQMGDDIVVSPVLVSEEIGTMSRETLYQWKMTSELNVNDSELVLKVQQEWDWYEKLRVVRQFNYLISYPLMRFLPLQENKVLIHSNSFREYTGSPKQISEYLVKNYPELNIHWVFRQPSLFFAEKVQNVRFKSLKYWYDLATAKYIIENNSMPLHYGKRKGQIEIQTLDKTFLDKRGFDSKLYKTATRGKQNNLRKITRRWDLLLSPSAYMTEIVRRAYDYDGKVLSVGYPKNDMLLTTKVSVKKLKNQYQIPLDKKVLLYLPAKSDKQLRLDLDKLKSKFSDTHILLLYLPIKLANQIDFNAYRDFAYDVSYESQLQSLYLISDILITDYNEGLFDFLLLNKPMIFYTPSQVEFDVELEKTYIDYLKEVPGPIATNMDELIAAIDSNLDIYDNNRIQFRQKYMGQQVSDSTSKVVEMMFSIDNGELKQVPSEKIILNRAMRLLKIKSIYKKIFHLMTHLPKTKTMVFESFYGRKYSDNPKALYEYAKQHYPDYRLIWSVEAGSEKIFADQGIPFFVKDTLRGMWIQARAKYWIQNTRLPLWKNHGKDTILLQTWHGTPLKTLGVDIKNVTMPGTTTEKYHRNFTHDTKKWTYLVSPNEYSTNIFESAFQKNLTSMINSGYPRNDILYNYTENDIHKIKDKVGVPQDKKVVLYAPTWRDNQNAGQGNYFINLQLDLDKIKNAFGDNVIVLIRAHYLISKNLDLSQYTDIAIDVSNYQDINDLYLISDVLITDYSSVFFDFANLRRPMIFFAYDWEEYGGETRGFYFDYQTVPGPIVQTTDEVICALKEALSSDSLYPGYEEFLNTYCAWEDGHASERVFNMVLNHLQYTLSEEKDFEAKEAVLNGKGVIWNKESTPLYADLSKYIGQTVKLKRAARLVDPLQKRVIGPMYYYIHIDVDNDKAMSGWIASASIASYSLIK